MMGIITASLFVTVTMGLNVFLYGANLARKNAFNLDEERIVSDAKIIEEKLLRGRLDLHMLRDMPHVQGILLAGEHDVEDPWTNKKIGEFGYFVREE